jgi:hypothetical protein
MSTRSKLKLMLALVLAAMLAIAAAACGESSDSKATTKVTTGTAAPRRSEDAPNVAGYPPEFQGFARCLRDQGVAPPPPAQWMAPGGSSPEMLRAAARCRRYLPPYGQQILDQMLSGG